MTGARYWLGLGANLGDRWAALEAAVRALADAGIDIEAVSGVYETAPRDLDDQPPFLNAAARVRSTHAPQEMLALVKGIERQLGRDPTGRRFGPRVIDCDLLLWDGGRWAAADLEVPHPRLTQRRFALVPLLEIDPGLTLPDGTPLARIEAALDAGEQAVRRLEPGLRPPDR